MKNQGRANIGGMGVGWEMGFTYIKDSKLNIEYIKTLRTHRLLILNKASKYESGKLWKAVFLNHNNNGLYFEKYPWRW